MNDFVEIPGGHQYSLSGTMTVAANIIVPLPISISIPVLRSLFQVSVVVFSIFFEACFLLAVIISFSSLKITTFHKLMILCFVALSILLLRNLIPVGVMAFHALRHNGPHLTADRDHFWCFQLTKPIPMSEIRSTEIIYGWKRSLRFVKIVSEHSVECIFLKPRLLSNVFIYSPNSYTSDISITQAIAILSARQHGVR
jgi:hypothetical protein